MMFFELDFNNTFRVISDAVDELRQTRPEKFLPPLQIAVIGDQNSGKSSVIERLSGIPFPRGKWLVTRCPIQIVMTRTKEGSRWKGVIKLQRSNYLELIDVITEPAKIGLMIIELTNRLTQGSSSGFSTDSIVIEISSPSVPDLIVIDLPGIIRTTTGCRKLHSVNHIIEKYIAQPHTIILVLIPATQDIEISAIHILHLAKKYDPQGIRTIGVITKPDRVQAGSESEVLEVLQNIRKPLLFGYVMVRNPDSDSAEALWTHEQTRHMEEEYLFTHEYWGRCEKSSLGTHSLSVRLTHVLATRIIEACPDISSDVDTLLEETSKDKGHIGEDRGRGRGIWVGGGLAGSARELYGTLQTSFSGAILSLSSLIDHAFDAHSLTPLLTESPNLQLLARFQDACNTLSEAILMKGLVFTKFRRMETSYNKHLPGFLSYEIFEMSMKQTISGWEEPIGNFVSEVVFSCGQACKDLIRHCVRSNIGIQSFLISQIPSMKSALSQYIQTLVRNAKNCVLIQDTAFLACYIETMKRYRKDRFKTQLFAFLNTNKKTILTSQWALTEAVTDWYMSSLGDVCDNDQVTDELHLSLLAYWETAHRRFVDTVTRLDIHLKQWLLKWYESLNFYDLSLFDCTHAPGGEQSQEYLRLDDGDDK